MPANGENPVPVAFPVFDTDAILQRVRHAREHHDVDIQQLREWKKEVSDHMSSLRLLSPMLLEEINYLKNRRRAGAAQEFVPSPAMAMVHTESESESGSESEYVYVQEEETSPYPIITILPRQVPPESDSDSESESESESDAEPAAVVTPSAPSEEPIELPSPGAVAATALALASDTTIDELLQTLTNAKQRDSLNRLKLRHADDQMYFVDYERTNVTRGTARQKAVVGKFTILGAMSSRGERSCYNVTMSKLGGEVERTFNCDCPAHRFQRGGEYSACKHICFVLCRVVGYVKHRFFQTYQLNEGEMEIIQQKMTLSRETILQETGSHHGVGAGAGAGILRLTRSSFLESERPLDCVECPICFDTVEDGENRVNCPDCKNHVHRECMEVWLSRNKSCVYCRSSKWRHFTACFVQGGTRVIQLDDDSDSD